MDFLSNSLALFYKGGLVMYPMVLCSIMVVAIAVERFWFYQKEACNTDVLLQELETKLNRDDWQGALLLCENASGVTATMLVKGLRNHICGNHKLEGILEGSAAVSAAKLRERLNYLDTIVTLAPLLGLLGTVSGMISSFSIMNIRSGQPQAITGGVGEALVATATGLCVATLALIVYSYFSQRVDTIITSMEQGCSILIEAAGRSDRV